MGEASRAAFAKGCNQTSLQRGGLEPPLGLPEPIDGSLLLLLSRFSHVQLCATPEMAAHQAPVPGILQASILEWVAISLPFPSPVHESEK